jgi:ubiquinone/menaquinone biosynthesis C-methylase UbiE
MTTSFAHDSPRLAAAYDRLSDMQLEGGRRLAERLGLVEGARVLDVGCGTGRLARWIAGLVGPTGRVVGIDPLAERIAIARAGTEGGADERASAGAPIAFEIGQAEDLHAFADESFDAVSMSSVFHWLSDKPKALAEARRVLRPGGRLGVTTLPRELSGASSVAGVLAPLLQRAPYEGRVDLSKLAIASRGNTTTDVVSMVLQSGLELTELHVMPRTWSRATGQEVVDFLEASSFGNFLLIVPEELRAPLRADLVAGFEARRGADGRIVTRDYGLLLMAARA